MTGIFIYFALPGQKLFQLAGRIFDKFSLLQMRFAPQGDGGTEARFAPQGDSGTGARLPHKGTAVLKARQPYKGAAAKLARQPTRVFKLVDKIFTGIFSHTEIITQSTTLLNIFHPA
jgi:hypothetical protein